MLTGSPAFAAGVRCQYGETVRRYKYVPIERPGPGYYPFHASSTNRTFDCARICTATCACEIYHLDEMRIVCTLFAHEINMAGHTGSGPNSNAQYDAGSWMEKTVGE